MTNEPEQDDSKLSTMKAALAGKPMAIDALLEDYLPQIRAFVRMKLGKELRKREAETDIVQSTCRRVLAYQGSGLQFEREAQFRAWLFTAAQNTIREKARFHQAQKRDVKHEIAAPRESVLQLQQGYARMATPSGLAAAGEEVLRIEAALDALEPDHREVISLCRLVGLTSDEAAEHMGRSAVAVRKLLSRALFKLSKELG